MAGLIEMIEDLGAEVDRQAATDAMWEGEDQQERLRLELRILHAIVERDPLLAKFREARAQLFLD